VRCIYGIQNYAKYKEKIFENYAAERNLFFSELRTFADKVWSLRNVSRYSGGEGGSGSGQTL
jgi:hypothetical protein